MNNIVTLASRSVVAPVVSVVSASRGVLALQGTGLSVASIIGARPQAPAYAIAADKSEWGWHQAHIGFHTDAAHAFAVEADRMTANLQAARLRNAHPATVISSRHRSRFR
ncbi:hypothetical protein J2W56_005570 [Nocardia kruczakiae]|uniref:Excreted virulence factor EspC (Type VII ESX diderm) n=1 Tax=Nocardia kruczakiae TaxID=261477 RepID=A0ABU1XMN8_9NOCA|nr:hypothetical protein [Nocardia kruczakiae]